MKLTVVRHGETLENKYHIVQGQNPGHLSRLGKQQAKELRDKLAGEHFDIIYCSDLKRCVDTNAFIVSSHTDTNVNYSPAIRELSYGIFEGFPYFFRSVGSKGQARLGGKAKAPGGESWDDLTNRLTDFLNEIYGRHASQHVLVITHGGPIGEMNTLINGTNLRDTAASIPNCSIWHWEMRAPVKTKTVQ